MIHLPTLRQMQYLVALDDHRNFLKAAESCAVTHSTLSAGLQDMESILGAELVDRSNRKLVRFTPAGEDILKDARHVIMRMEQMYPFPLAQIEKELAGFPSGTPLVWVQEEPWNQGAWHFVRGRLPSEVTARHPLKVVARRAAPSPSTGSMGAHKLEQAELVDQALGEGGSAQ